MQTDVKSVWIIYLSFCYNLSSYLETISKTMSCRDIYCNCHGFDKKGKNKRYSIKSKFKNRKYMHQSSSYLWVNNCILSTFNFYISGNEGFWLSKSFDLTISVEYWSHWFNIHQFKHNKTYTGSMFCIFYCVFNKLKPAIVIVDNSIC